jgi:RND family efflux transporter MFP subunit
MTARWLRSVSLCGLLLGLSSGCRQAPPPEVEKTPPATVKWEPALQARLEEWTELVGTTLPLPDHEAHVSAPVAGMVVSVLGAPGGKPVVEGQRVEKGTILVQLDPSILQANLAKSEAAREVQREDERQTQYAVELATAEVERLRKLDEGAGASGRTSLVSPVERLKAEYALKDAQSKLKAASAKLVASAREEDAIRAELKLLTLSAPLAGHLGRIMVAPGQTLSAGTTVAEIVDLDEQIDVLCYVPPALVSRLKVGQEARSGSFDKDPSSTESEAVGRIEFIAEQAEPETGNFAVKVRFDNKDAHLRSNRVLRLRVLTQPGRETLSLPESAVNESEEAPMVVIVEPVKNDKGEMEMVARRLQATLGVRDRSLQRIEILGLDDPDKEAKVKWQGEVKDQQFVVEKGQGLQTGDKVKLDVDED